MDDGQERDEMAGYGGAADRGMQSEGPTGDPSPERESVLTMVCVKCGSEYFFVDEPPATLACRKCGNSVFRSFVSSEDEDAIAADYREVTERDLDPDDPEGDTLPGDLLDLRRM